MYLKKIQKVQDVKVGDSLLIHYQDGPIVFHSVVDIITNITLGEIVLRFHGACFSLTMFLEERLVGVKDCCVIMPGEPAGDVVGESKSGFINTPNIPFLSVMDHADPSVGLFEATYRVECPVSEDDDEDEKDFFRRNIIGVFSEFATGRVSAIYDWGVEETASEFLLSNGITSSQHQQIIAAIPSWACWYAIDEKGSVGAYQREPVELYSIWTALQGRSCSLGITIRVKDWKKTKTRIKL